MLQTKTHAAPAMRRVLVPLLVAFALFATAWSIVTPVFEAPDESTHFFVAQHIARTGRLPVQTIDVAARGPWEQEGSQPPLYYALAAPLLHATGVDIDELDSRVNPQNSMGFPAVVGNDNRFVHVGEAWPWPAHVWAVRLARGLSTVLGLVAVAATWGLAARVFGGHSGPRSHRYSSGPATVSAAARPWLALAATALFAFNPQVLATFSALSNDPAIIALAALALWLLARLWDGEDDRGTIVGLAIVVGLAPLAKVSGLTVLAFALATVAWVARRRRDARWGLRVGSAIAAATLAISGWWYLRNVRLYGTLTGLSAMLPEGVGRELNLARWLVGLPAELAGLWRSSWGIFGWFTLPLPEWAFALIAVATALAGLGLLRAALRGLRTVRYAVRSRDGDAGPIHIASAASPRLSVPWSRLAWLGLWWALLFVALLRWLLLVKGAHGRLMMPAWGAVAIALVAGWRALGPRDVQQRAEHEPGGSDGVGPFGTDAVFARDRALAGALIASVATLSLGALLGVVRPAFAGPRAIAEADIPASAERVDLRFGDRVELLAVEHPERVVEGGLLPITLYWRVAEGAAGDDGEAATAPDGRSGLVALRLDQPVAVGPEDAPETWPDPAAAVRLPMRIVPGEAYLSHPVRGAVPFDALPRGVIVVDRHHVPVPALARTLDPPGTPFVDWPDLVAAVAATGGDTDGLDVGGPRLVSRADPDALRRFVAAGRPADATRGVAMPVAARLSVHVYDRATGERWPLAALGPVVDGPTAPDVRTELERSVVIAPDPRRDDGAALVAHSAPVAVFGDPPIVGLSVLSAATSAEGEIVLDLPGMLRPVSAGGLDYSLPARILRGPTWSTTRVAWRVERAPDADLALFVHLRATGGAGGPADVLATFDGEPASHADYPSRSWRAGDLLIADVGWALPMEAAPGRPYLVQVGLYERSEGAPRLPAFGPDGTRLPDDAADLTRVVVEGGGY